MKKPSIEIDGLSKRYRLGAIGATTIKESFHRWLSKLSPKLGAEIQEDKDLWALKDISLKVNPGEVIGVIGKNGAGKSTLLKILSKITEPTKGRATIRGRVSSLLEVGTGFHPELTGGENIYLNGAILGMKKNEIQKKFDEIVAFAELEKFVDTPVKHYSSGMYVRLAFAVAAHLEPEILLVDEVLAVGDAAFQKKCLGKMGSVAQEGRTIFFVSHNMVAIQALCDRSICLSHGRIVEDGSTDQVITRYLRDSLLHQSEQSWQDPSQAPGNEDLRLKKICARPENGETKDPISIHTPIVIECEYWNLKPNANINISFSLFNAQGIQVFVTGPIHESQWYGKPCPKGLFRSICYVPGDLLNAGSYSVTVRAIQNQKTTFFKYQDAIFFDVIESAGGRKQWYGPWHGVVRPNLKWTTDKINERRAS